MPIALLMMVVFSTAIAAVAALPAPGENVMPEVAKPRNTHCSMCNCAPLLNTTPDVPDALKPLKVSPRRLTASPAPAATTMPRDPRSPGGRLDPRRRYKC